MKKEILVTVISVFLLIGSGVLAMSLVKTSQTSDLFKANVVALAKEADSTSIGETVRDVLGCPGGDRKCFKGKVEVGPVKVSGTWYLQ